VNTSIYQENIAIKLRTTWNPQIMHIWTRLGAFESGCV